MENKTSKAILNQFTKGKKPYECDICGKILDEEQNFKIHIESVHEGKKP